MKKPILGIIVAIAIITSLVFPAQIFGDTSIPLSLWGSLTINGDPAPIGTIVEARGDNVRTDIQDNPLTTTETGKYGTHGIGKHLVVQLEEGTEIEPDTIISFYINGVEADQSFQWQELENPENSTDLTVTIPITRKDTLTDLSSSKNPSVVGNSVTFTANVSGVGSTGNTPSGMVYFYDGNKSLGGYTLASGSAKFTTSSLTTGTHTIKAVYTGDTYFNGSEDTLKQTVNSESGGGSGSGEGGTPPTTTTPTTQPTSTPTATPAAGSMQILDLSGFIDGMGMFLRSFEGVSLDGKAKINILSGTVGKTADGSALKQITIQQINNPGGTLAPSANFGMAGLCYDFEPGKAQFSQPVIITLFYDASIIPAGLKPYIAWWNYETDKWEKLETFSTDESLSSIKAKTTHLGVFAVLYSKTAASTTTTSTAASTPKPTQSTPVPTPTSVAGTPGWLVPGLIVLFVVVVLIVIYFVMRRKSHPKNPE